MERSKSGIKILTVVIVGIAIIFLANIIKYSVNEHKLKTDYNTAVQLISDGNYRDAQYKFYRLKGYKDSELLLNYANYMVYKNSDVSFAYRYMLKIPTSYDGVFAVDIANERKYIAAKYDEYLKKTAEDKKKAEEEREKLRASYAYKLPEVGMDREFINDTLIGKCDDDFEYTNYEDRKKVNSYRYVWYSDDKSDIVFVAKFRENKCISAEKYYPTVYWRGDIPNFSAKRYKPTSTAKYDEDKYDALEYDDPEDFYYDNYGYFEGYEDAEDYFYDIWG